MTDVTHWNCWVSSGGEGPTAALTVSKNGAPAENFTIKAVCYSPCPIGGSNAYGPNIGDWFWDSFDGVTNWEDTWSNDLQLICNTGANSIRVYCFLDTQLPPASQTQVFTHTSFLDTCYSKGLYVIIGIPLPQSLFSAEQTTQPSIQWWEDVLTQTVQEVAAHPAVLGFTIANEVDNGSVDTYGPTASYWWGQVEKMAALAKSAAPDKLIGIANHDDPGICMNAATYMAQCPSIDFWGVNTYQPQSFDSVFGANGTVGYSTLTGPALKPVILTEYGFPATGRKTEDTLNPCAIYSDTTMQQKVSAVLNIMLPKAYSETINLGLCYFEFCDEWWNQSAYSISPGITCICDQNDPNNPNSGDGGSFAPPNIYTQYGGPIACGFPNYYWDNDGFGLYSVGVGSNRDPSAPWNSNTNAPALPLDTRTIRSWLVGALQNQWIFSKKNHNSRN
jgi:hypothetical protein